LCICYLPTENKVKNEQEGELKDLNMVDITEIKINPNQPRKVFNEVDLKELSDSIKVNGIIQPLIVFKNKNQLELIAGERRLRAARLAGLEQVPVVIKKVTKKEHMAMAIIENVQRSDLNCVEEALAYFQLMNEFGLTQEEVAKQIGKDRSTIANFLRILRLPKDVIKHLQKEELSFGHAKVLASLKEDELINRLALEVIDANLSVRDLEQLIKNKKTKKTVVKNKFFDEKADALKQKLEKRTGYHFDIKTKNNGSGTITIKYSNEVEFNNIFDYLFKQ
jgi:ParB family chromosome partitioning protein